MNNSTKQLFALIALSSAMYTSTVLPVKQSARETEYLKKRRELAFRGVKKQTTTKKEQKQSLNDINKGPNAKLFRARYVKWDFTDKPALFDKDAEVVLH